MTDTTPLTDILAALAAPVKMPCPICHATLTPATLEHFPDVHGAAGVRIIVNLARKLLLEWDSRFVGEAAELITVVAPELDKLSAEKALAEAKVAAAYAFADEMADYRSHGSHIVTEQAQRLRGRLDQASTHRPSQP